MTELSLRELQLFSLDILKDVDAFCRKEGIRYSLAYGTLIGAIRHKGFIPWDDDVDIVMPRPDFERFCKSYKSPDFEVVYQGNESSAILCFARVVDCKRTQAFIERPWTGKICGVWIDIFPYDGIEPDKAAFERRYRKMRRMCALAYKFRRMNYNVQADSPLYKIVNKHLKSFLSCKGRIPSRLIRNIEKECLRYPFEGSKYLCQMTCLDDAPKMYDASDFQEYCDVEFEGNNFMAIKGYDNYLRLRYGDYMTLPPEEQRVPKQGWIRFMWK